MSEKKDSKILKDFGSNRQSGKNTVFEKRDGIGKNPKPTSIKPGFNSPGSR